VTLERERRDALEAARAAAAAAHLRDARLASDLDALERDRRRLLDERGAAEAEMASGRRALAASVPPRDLDLEADLAEAERALAHALAELGALRSARQAHGEELAALRRAAAARQAEAETARRRLTEVENRAAQEADQARTATERRASLETALATARTSLAATVEGERAAAARHEKTRQRASAADAERAAAHETAVAASAAAAAMQAQLDALTARLAEEETRGIARAARRAGGRRLDEDLMIDPPLRSAAEAALAEATRAYVVGADAVQALAAERGSLVVLERSAGPIAPGDARERRFREALAVAGGGTLDAAVRRDATGAARRILARAAWLPDLAACLAIQAALPAGWIAVPRDGGAVVTELGVTLGAGESVLERRAESARLTEEADRLEAEAARSRGVAVRLAAAAKEAMDAVEGARVEESRAGGVRRAAEDAERLAARQLEAVVREASWHEAQLERVEAELGRARAAVAVPGDDPTTAVPVEGSADDGAAESDGTADSDALTAWEARAVDLRVRRDRLAQDAAARDAARRDAENGRARRRGIDSDGRGARGPRRPRYRRARGAGAGTGRGTRRAARRDGGHHRARDDRPPRAGGDRCSRRGGSRAADVGGRRGRGRPRAAAHGRFAAPRRRPRRARGAARASKPSTRRSSSSSAGSETSGSHAWPPSPAVPCLGSVRRRTPATGGTPAPRPMTT